MSPKRSLYTASIGVLGIVLLIVGVSCNKVNPTSGKNNSGPLIDADGNVYTTVKIGNQEWSAENLRTTKYNDSTVIPLVTDLNEWRNLITPAYCHYSNTTNSDSIKKFGALYNWYAVKTGKLAPRGWHVPTDEEWTTLENYLIANGYNYDGTTTGNKIAKSMTSKTDWEASTGPGAIGNDLSNNNRSGFSALPGGYRDYVVNFAFGGLLGNWWSATEANSSNAFDRNLISDYDLLNKNFYTKSCGCSVRLVRDN